MVNQKVAMSHKGASPMDVDGVDEGHSHYPSRASSHNNLNIGVTKNRPLNIDK